jgi:uncharacterized protein YbjT (DUF2867 family)
MADSERRQSGTVLLTGATGFVGSHLFPALRSAGMRVLCASRDPQRAARRFPGRDWVRFDVEDPNSVAPALSGVHAVVYLVHQMGGGADYPQREARAARMLRDAAYAADVERIVYLGGVAPPGPVSPHLQSRLATGALLREGPVPTIELRAGMIIGEGSASWQIVRDLAARLPAMVLPRWLHNRSSPVAIEDVVAALLWALSAAPARAGWYDVPGPEVVTHRELITRIAHVMGNRPAMIGVPVVTPILSSYWIALVTRIGLDLARELVQGLQSDLIPGDASVWEHLGDHQRIDLETAARNALACESSGQSPTPEVRVRMEAIGERMRETRFA